MSSNKTLSFAFRSRGERFRSRGAHPAHRSRCRDASVVPTARRRIAFRNLVSRKRDVHVLERRVRGAAGQTHEACCALQ